MTDKADGPDGSELIGSVRPPVRALRLTLALEADTPEDMATALHNLAHRVERDQVTEGCWGGPSDGAIYELLVDPDMTHDLYHQKLREYLNSRPKRAA